MTGITPEDVFKKVQKTALKDVQGYERKIYVAAIKEGSDYYYAF